MKCPSTQTNTALANKTIWEIAWEVKCSPQMDTFY